MSDVYCPTAGPLARPNRYRNSDPASAVVASTAASDFSSCSVVQPVVVRPSKTATVRLGGAGDGATGRGAGARTQIGLLLIHVIACGSGDIDFGPTRPQAIPRACTVTSCAVADGRNRRSPSWTSVVKFAGALLRTRSVTAPLTASASPRWPRRRRWTR